jgi:hypothetical protein
LFLLSETPTTMALLPRDKKRTEVFVCDHCGMRKRLARDQRHWCDECNQTPPVELRLTRARLHYQKEVALSAPPPSASRVSYGLMAR